MLWVGTLKNFANSPFPSFRFAPLQIVTEISAKPHPSDTTKTFLFTLPRDPGSTSLDEAMRGSIAVALWPFAPHLLIEITSITKTWLGPTLSQMGR